MKEKIREMVISCGADLCGIANIDRFHDAPRGYRPTDIYADCKSVISIGVALQQGLRVISPRLVYGHFNYISCHEVDIAAFKVAKELEESFRCTAVPIPCDTPYEYWDGDNMEGRGLLSMKHIAERAGLGSLGKSSLFINKRYGNMLTLGAVLIDLELPSDELTEGICIADCRKCIDACPVNAIENGIVDQKLCRNTAYGKTARGFGTVDCNACRNVCPVNR